MTCPEVAELLGDGPRTVQYWVQEFEQHGLAGLLEGERPGRPPRLSPDHLKRIGAALRTTPADVGLSGNIWDGKTLSAYTRSELGVELGVRQCQRLFRKLQFRLRKPRPVLARADPARQAEHKRKLQAQMLDPKVDLWAMDEVHFQLYGSRCRMWIPPETKDAILLHHPGRKSIGYFGAVRLRDGKFVYQREDESFNAVTCFTFLRTLRRESSSRGRRVVVISDNAKYHHALMHKEWRALHASTFALDYLPPYSPDLNPIERMWKLTRRLCIHNRYFPALAAISDAVEGCFDNWIVPNGTLRRLCAII